MLRVLRSLQFDAHGPRCGNQLNYFSGQMVYQVRERCGKQLAHEAPVAADLVSTVPESATPAALGYAKEVRVTVTTKDCYTPRAVDNHAVAA